MFRSAGLNFIYPKYFEMPQTTQEGLVRIIGRWDLLALVTNSIVGAGIFGLPSKLFALAGD